MKVRVLCLHGQEVALTRPESEQQLLIADLKRLVLSKLRTGAGGCSSATRNDTETKAENGDEEDETFSSSFVLFKGQILADMDHFNIQSLSPSDFFVFVTEELPYDTLELEQETDEDDRMLKKQKMDESGRKDDTKEVVQLMEMGFEAEAAHMALETSDNDVATAVHVLMGGSNLAAAETNREQKKHNDRAVGLLANDSTLEVFRSLLEEPLFQRVQSFAKTDVFAALMLLKEHAPEDWLHLLNKYPVEALRSFGAPSLLSDGVAQESESTDNDGANRMTAGQDVSEHKDSHESISQVENEKVDRLCAMGFERDLALAMYISCGKDEQAAVNALLENTS